MTISGRGGAARDPWSDRLSEYLDGELNSAAREALERHLAGCSHCALLLADLRRVVARARTLENAPPPTNLWPGIAAQLTPRSPAARPQASAGWWLRRFELSVPQLAAAGVLLVALSSAAIWLVARGPLGGVRSPATLAAPTSGPIAASTSPESAATAPMAGGSVGGGSTGAAPMLASYANASGNAGYDAAVTELEQALRDGRGRLDPRTLRVVEKNLLVIDRALGEARRAVAADPGNTWLRLHLAATMKRKVDLLQSVTMLPSAQG